jgi:drug/metabolite transporter (DMT)-like permease
MTLLAIALVLISAVMHAAWNYVAKQATTRGAIFVWMFASFEIFILGPFALYACWRGQCSLTPIDGVFIVGSATLHVLYFLLLSTGYKVGDLSIVYPLARGAGPLFVTFGAVLLLNERPTLLAVLATVLITGGVFVLTGDPLRLRQSSALPGILFGLLTALSIAAYSLWDSYAVSELMIAPLVFQWGIGTSRAVLMTPYALAHRSEVRQAWREDRGKALIVAVLSPGAYLLILMALTFSPVSYVMPMRSISILIGVLLGTQLLGEADRRRRLMGSGAMMVGVVMLGLG